MTSLSKPWSAALAGAALVVGSAAQFADAAGPLLVLDGKPVLWAAREVRGGPLDTVTVTVDERGRRTVFYRVDPGPLGPIPAADAARLADRIFDQYSAIPTAEIRFVNAGPILDPDSGLPMDVDASNFGKVLDSFQNPIVFDADGSITGGGGVLGFFGFLGFEPDEHALTEAIVVLNGAVLDPPLISTTSFIGVFQHEFGHFAGPLDHSQLNGGIADPFNSISAAVPDGLDSAQAYDLFAPFTESLYPFVFTAPAGSTVGFADSGYFIATLDLDTRNALSSLYPALLYRATTGSIEGEVFLHSGGDKVPIPGMNVVARRIHRTPYPPPPGTVAFPAPPRLDEDGVPAPPPSRPATDPLATASSAVTGMEFGYGRYRIQGLPPGLYEVMLQEISPWAVAGSGIGPLPYFQVILPHKETYFHTSRTSLDVRSFTPVPSHPLRTTPGIDFEIRGMDSSEPSRLVETAPHFTVATALDLGPLPALVSATSAATDPFQVRIDWGGGFVAPIHDLYRFHLSAPTLVYITLEPDADAGDLDLYLFARPGASNVVPLARTIDSSTQTSRELISFVVPAGTFYVGVSAYEGSGTYRLRVVPEAGNLTPGSP